MQTLWSRGHTTHNQDWDLILESQIGLIGVWHNENMPHDTNTIEMK